MSKQSSEQPLRVSLSRGDAEDAFQGEGRRHSDSDASSLESLLGNDLDETGSTTRLRSFDTPELDLDPKNWPRWKKMFVAITIAFYTMVSVRSMRCSGCLCTFWDVSRPRLPRPAAYTHFDGRWTWAFALGTTDRSSVDWKKSCVYLHHGRVRACLLRHSNDCAPEPVWISAASIRAGISGLTLSG
nr:hypothetical protein CFP56_69995 [Quercus suber]